MPAAQTIGVYSIRAEIGAGGMGVVYEGVSKDGACVAVKVLHPDRRGDPYARRRFLDEGVAGMVVDHPNVASTIAHSQTDDGVPFLVMERLHGEMLGARIQRGEGHSLRRCASIAREILIGLDALHSAGVVHGDIKSDNVIVERRDDGSDVVKLIDLGLAHVRFSDEEPSDGEGDVAGTPEYMAPEVIRGLGSTRASDIYAVGIVLYELITGATPFAGGCVDEILHRHLADPAVPPSLRRPATPAILERIVLRAIEKDATRRFATAAAFASALRVAMTVLDDVETEHAPFSRLAPTLDWITHAREPQWRRIARGTPTP